jgi:diaminopimelate decarboxylase
MLLPGELDIGDWICVAGMGAYTLAIKSSFNSMESVVRIE